MTQTIVLPASIRIGANVTIEVQTSEGAREHKSRIEDFEEGLLVVALPSERGEFVPMPAGQFVTLQVSTQSAANLFVEGEIMGRRTQPFPVMLVRPISVESNQQRNFHRVQIRIDPLGAWRWIGNGTPALTQRLPRSAGGDPNWQAVHATIVDISGGGLGVVADIEIPKESWMGVRFPLPVTDDPFEAHGIVMMSRARPHSGKTEFHVGVRFEGLSKVDQERLVKANHQYQIEERRKARGL
jgi:c-di-GMP-binding flagellar brake protein YcgR